MPTHMCTHIHTYTATVLTLWRKTGIIIAFARRAQANQAPNPLVLLLMSPESLRRFHPTSCDSHLSSVSPFSLALSPPPEKEFSHSPCFSPRQSSQIIISRCITILNGIPMLDCIGENLFSKGFLLCNMYVTSSNRHCIIFIVLSLRKY